MTSQIRKTVPRDETPASECEYCHQPFPTNERLVLHKGVEHHHQLDESEREAFEAALRAEEEDLRSLRLKALTILVCLYFGFVLMYAIFA